MSLSFEKLNVVHQVDPRVDLLAESKKQYGVLTSGVDTIWQGFQATSLSNNNITFTANPSSARIFVNRRMYTRVQFQITFTGISAAPGMTLLQCMGLSLDPSAAPGVSVGTAYADAPRCLPLSQACSTQRLSLNNYNITQNINQYFRIFQRYHNPIDNQDRYASLSPSMPDQSQAYSDLFGFARTPLKAYGDNVVECPRGGFVGATIVRNDATGIADTAIVNLDVFEPIYLNPALFGYREESQGFLNLQNLSINLTLQGRSNGVLGGLAASLWSHDAVNNPATISSTSVSVLSAQAYFNYITPDLVMDIPKEINYQYFEPYYSSVNQVGPVLAGATQTIQGNTLQLSSVPNRVYLWVAEQDVDFDMTKTDTFFQITNVSIAFADRNPLVSTMSPYDLYLAAVRNGCNLSWTQWSKHVGSVVCLSFGLDIPMSELLAPGVMEKVNFQATVTCKNLSGRTITPTLGILLVSEGVATISPLECKTNIGVLTGKDVLEAKKQTPVPYQTTENIYGGKFSFSDFLSILRRGARGALNVAKAVVPHAAPQYATALSAADQLAQAIGVGAPMGGRALPRRRMLTMLRR